ncbi:MULTISPECIES: DUF948 domain-containing protein [Thermodesulfovibrio]|uniref:DUF948 domain-containing protein n=2 Tax=Thermodesulfovibrio yellowstonii TaxID=28262 RepID=B5YFZ5_THEYD|nr:MULTISPECIES: DUF948 domain-containing protein [Thermodesulfovibrio]ACI22034.1 hypothetical protein THEYE_A1392 [Thermodesulfovibrio yellowstonii DSM 11347]MDI6865826.1 DUF948 domain-containing protein [Thermodesulfovibrio yellowstonii]GLI53216.1 hypothetical protein TISLANDTSLP1_09090 [Thermodesulfovibrio islandicus]
MNETWIIILSIGYFLATLSLIAALIFLIVVAIELRRGINAFKEFLNVTKTKLDPTINEAEKVIHGVRESVEDVNEVTYKIRELSKTVEKLNFIVSELVTTVEKVKSSLSLKSSALKTAITVAANVFLENIKKGGK